MIYAPFTHPLSASVDPRLLAALHGVRAPQFVANDESGDMEMAAIFADVRACLVN